jgi:hypothetical protein
MEVPVYVAGHFQMSLVEIEDVHDDEAEHVDVASAICAKPSSTRKALEILWGHQRAQLGDVCLMLSSGTNDLDSDIVSFSDGI